MDGAVKEDSKAREYYEMLSKQIKKLGEKEMADILPVVAGAGGDGLFGGGAGGGGLIGGLILGSLLRNNGNLFGGNGGDVGGVATQSGVQNVVNQSAIQQELADIKASIPFNEAQVQLALAGTQTALTAQINNNAMIAMNGINSVTNTINQTENMISGKLTDLDNHIQQVNQSVATSALIVTSAIKDDGEKTRALITHQYEATLNRQLSDANAQIIALQNKAQLDNTARGIEITTTNNISQAQAQQQQQQQFQALVGVVSNLANDLQYIRATNQAINIGSGLMQANPTNTNTNVRA